MLVVMMGTLVIILAFTATALFQVAFDAESRTIGITAGLGLIVLGLPMLIYFLRRRRRVRLVGGPVYVARRSWFRRFGERLANIGRRAFRWVWNHKFIIVSLMVLGTAMLCATSGSRSGNHLLVAIPGAIAATYLAGLWLLARTKPGLFREQLEWLGFTFQDNKLSKEQKKTLRPLLYVAAIAAVFSAGLGVLPTTAFFTGLGLCAACILALLLIAVIRKKEADIWKHFQTATIVLLVVTVVVAASAAIFQLGFPKTFEKLSDSGSPLRRAADENLSRKVEEWVESPKTVAMVVKVPLSIPTVSSLPVPPFTPASQPATPRGPGLPDVDVTKEIYETLGTPPPASSRPGLPKTETPPQTETEEEASGDEDWSEEELTRKNEELRQRNERLERELLGEIPKT